jgi:hypothetical protein
MTGNLLASLILLDTAVALFALGGPLIAFVLRSVS